jgi:hypothetical protein
MCVGHWSDPEGKARAVSKKRTILVNYVLPAWIAQEVFCRSFARKEFSVLIF